MNSTDAENFINSLVRNLQILCHSNVEFRNDIEVVGHLYLKVDKTKKFNYIVDEKVCKNDASSTMFVSNSYHSINHNKKAQTTEERTLSATVEQSQLPKTICSNINRSNSDQLAAQSFDDVEPPIKTKKLSHNIIDTQIMPVRPRDVVKRNQQHHHSASIKVEDTSMDLINVKREPEDDNITSNLNCFFESKSGNMSAGGVIDTGQLTDDELFTNFTKDKHLALHPVSLHHNESQHLETLSELSAASTSTSNLSQDLSQHSTNNDIFSCHLNNMSSAYQVLEILAAADESPTPSYQDLAVRFKIDENIVRDYLQHKDSIREYFSNQRQKSVALSRRLTLSEKVQLIQTAELSSKPSQMMLARQFGISQPTTCRILLQKDKIMEEFTRAKHINSNSSHLSPSHINSSQLNS